MRYKFTNFYSNKTIKFFLFNILLFYVMAIQTHATATYKMSFGDLKVLTNSSIEASVFIENVGEEFILTSYQCAYSINQNIDLSSLSLSYVPGSSELLNEPNLYVGIDNIDGVTELTFVSYIGNDIINSKTLVGRFLLEGNLDVSNIDLLNIQWDFEGTISTIITGEGFANITNPSSHESIFPSQEESLEIAKVNIVDSEASQVTGDQFTDQMLYDGIHSMSNGGEYSSSSAGRWAVSGYPNWVTIDLGEETYIDHISVDGYESEQGVSYDCEFYTGNYDNKTHLVTESTQTGTQWSKHMLGGITTRYLTIVFTGSSSDDAERDYQGNSWCDIWEIEVYGNNSATGVEEDEEVDEEQVLAEETIPSEYGISQNYPNPFNPSTNVKVMMTESGSARLDVYNLLGERVLAVLDQELTAGIHEVNIDGSRLASGVYVYQLSVGNAFSEIKKMNLIK